MLHNNGDAEIEELAKLIAEENDTANTVAHLGGFVKEICQKSPNPLILYTGRTAELGGLLTELSRSNCTDPVVFGVDDLTQLKTTFMYLEDIKRFVGGGLCFTTFAWTPGQEAVPQPTQQFFTSYRAEAACEEDFPFGPQRTHSSRL